MKKNILIMILVLGSALFSCAQAETLLIDDFEGMISGGPNGTVDFGSGNGSNLKVTAGLDQKYTGKQSLKAEFNAVGGGYMYIARGFGLDAQNAGWMVKPEEIDWKKYDTITFYMFGTASKAQVAFDLKDSGNELWRFIVTDEATGWIKFECPLSGFSPRSDWQPDAAEKNELLDTPLKNYQFEVLPAAKGIFYFDTVELTKK